MTDLDTHVSRDVDLDERQRARVAFHISSRNGPVRPTADLFALRRPIAAVDIIDGLVIQSDEAETMRLIGDAFIRAAYALHTANGLPAVSA